MTKPALSSVLLASAIVFTSQTAMAEDNVAACEIVVQQKIPIPEDPDQVEQELVTRDEEPKAAMIATFIPAADFISSVFDEEPGHLEEVEGYPIQALMCERRYLIPTEYDLRMIRTGVPFYLSQDFDSTESGLMAVFLKDDKYQYSYSGEELSEDGQEILDYRMSELNKDEDRQD